MTEGTFSEDGKEHRMTSSEGKESVTRLEVGSDGTEKLVVYVDGKVWISAPADEVEQHILRSNKEEIASKVEQPEGWPFD